MTGNLKCSCSICGITSKTDNFYYDFIRNYAWKKRHEDIDEENIYYKENIYYTLAVKKEIIEIEKKQIIKEQDIKRIDGIASMVPSGEKLQELKKELLDEE